VGALAVIVPLDPEIGRQPDGRAWSDPSNRYGDYALFVGAGRAILAGDPGGAFSDPTVQTGPLALVWAAGLAGVLHLVGGPARLGLLITSVAVLAPAMYTSTLWASRLRPARWLYVVAIGALAVLLVPWQIPTLIAYQHPTYLWVPALWLGAAAAARRGRWVATGVMLAAASGLETWAVLAVPVILLSLPSWPARVRAGATWAAGTAAIWLPFALSDRFRMLDMTWPSSPTNILVELWGGPSTVTWDVRASEGVIVVAAGIATWLVGRSVTDSATVAIAAVAWARVSTDVQWFPYYRLTIFATTGAVVLAAAASYLADRSRRSLVGVAVGALLLAVAQAEALALSPVNRLALEAVAVVALVLSVRAVPGGPVLGAVGKGPDERRAGDPSAGTPPPST